jgi:hypothetical protein
MSDSFMDITLNSNYAANCESDSQGGSLYIIDGKVWRIGQQKISKWSKAKCNKVIKDNNTIDPQSTSIKDHSSH